MPRNPTAPPFPHTPATWLANFRYRLAGEDGGHLSPETLGFKLGVSGATVRRWEAGQSNPNEDDLVRFADVCRLSRHQREFVRRLFSRPVFPAEREPPRFREQVAAALSMAEPACLTDELFFIRAWNSSFEAHAGHFASGLRNGVNAVRLGLEVGRRSEPELENERVRTIVRQLWMWTAHVASEPAYATLIRELLQNDAFAENWRALIDDDQDEMPPLHLPIVEAESDAGPYIVHLGEILFPPLYRVFICQPLFDAGITNGRGSKPEVFFADQTHWSQ
jgi:hypothetical protein